MKIDEEQLLYARLKNQFLIERAPCTTVVSALCGLQARILEIYMKRYGLSVPDAALFTNRSGQRLTRVGVNYILNKYVAEVKEESPDLIPISVTPHVVRHSKASHLLSAGVNLIYIRDLLGHSSVTTTEIYATTNPEFLQKAIENSALKTTPKSSYAPNTKDLTDFLKRYRC